MEHHINIEEEQRIIDKDVHELPLLDPKCCCIYKVHEGLRKGNPEAYEPMLVSIGPYHHRNPKVQDMKPLKLQYLNSLLDRTGRSREFYSSMLADHEDKARKFYVHPIDLTGRDEFVEMMLLDGCFIIEYLHKICHPNKISDDPILKVAWMKSQISRDMMLLENQLPYFVLFQLYELTKKSEQIEETFNGRAIRVFKSLLPRPRENVFEYGAGGGNDTKKFNHLLHLIHSICVPSSEDKITKNSDGNDDGTKMRSAVELKEARVKFKKVGEGNSKTDTVSLFEINFDNGWMEIPCFIVDDYTETFFRNLIAYEQYSSDVNPKYFSDFAKFLDKLLNTEKDAKLLRLEGIIVNLLGDDKEVSALFNKLNEGVVFFPDYRYSKVCGKVEKHCQRAWNQTVATLRHNYFNNPWASVSTIAAGVLLTLTIAQTIAAYISL